MLWSPPLLTVVTRYIADCHQAMAGFVSGARRLTGFIENWIGFWGRPDLLKRDGLHPSRGGPSLV